jgi:prepilin-type processing-associated H-X9-DG protein
MDTSESQPEPTVQSKRWSRRTIGLLSVLYLLLGLALFSWLARVENEYVATGDSCQNNLKVLCQFVFTLYADEHGGLFPELSPRSGVLAVREDEEYQGIYPKYLTDLTMLRCPNMNSERPRSRWFWEAPPPSPAPLDTASNDECYLYLGYVIPDQETLEYFSEAYRARIAAGKPFDEELSLVSDDGAPMQIPRLSMDIPGITDTEEVQSTIPVFVERFPKGHVPGGANVAYLDGHVEWIKWGEKWPMTPEAMDVLLALDALGSE